MVVFLTYSFNKRNNKKIKDLELRNETEVKRLEFENNERLQKMSQEHEQQIVNSNNRYQRELERRLRNRLASEKSLQDARIDYEYDAKKKLYQEYEPLLFQLNELSESAYKRILGLARTSRQGNLVPHSGWLSNPTGYYIANTIYRFLAPLVVFRLMERRLTLFDLNLNSSFNYQYLFAKSLYHTFSRSFQLAEATPKLEYEPHNDNAKDRVKHPDKYSSRYSFRNN